MNHNEASELARLKDECRRLRGERDAARADLHQHTNDYAESAYHMSIERDQHRARIARLEAENEKACRNPAAVGRAIEALRHACTFDCPHDDANGRKAGCPYCHGREALTNLDREPDA